MDCSKMINEDLRNKIKEENFFVYLHFEQLISTALGMIFHKVQWDAYDNGFFIKNEELDDLFYRINSKLYEAFPDYQKKIYDNLKFIALTEIAEYKERILKEI
jgi:hypothetical protein